MCTRVFNNQNPAFLSTSRNMDWAEPLTTSLYYFKKGLRKVGVTQEEFKAWQNQSLDKRSSISYQPLKWSAEHSSVVAMVGDDDHGWASSDGINDAGLVANVLYDTGFSSGTTEDQFQLSVLRWVQFVLDTFDTVEKVESYFDKNRLQLIAPLVPGSSKSADLHLSVSDMNGDSLIIEVNNGNYKFYKDPSYNIMTNEPSYAEQLEIKKKLIKKANGDDIELAALVPGGPFSYQRFERASFYYHFLNTPESPNESLSQSKGVTASASVPVGFRLDGSGPNNAATLWTTVANQQENAFKYYFCNSQVVNIIWFDLSKDLPKFDTAKLDLIIEKNKKILNLNFDGCINGSMNETTDPFRA